jgi:Predicted transcriptional regulators
MVAQDEFEEIVFDPRIPVYLQVVRHFKERIATGRLRAGEVIPSRRELAAMLNINPNTAQRAYREMEEQKLIVTEGNKESRITTDEQVLRSVRSELIESEVEAFVRAVRKIDVSLEELIGLLQRKYEEMAGGKGHD